MEEESVKGYQVYDSSRHEKVINREWDANHIRQEIQLIISDFEAASSSEGSWPTHPLDDESRSPKWAQYSGAAGAVVSLRILKQAGYAVKEWSHTLKQIHTAYLSNPDYGYETGLHLGEIGILAPAYLANPDNRSVYDRLIRCMKETIDHQAREITSGGAGMMHAALTLFRITGELIWKDMFCEAAHSLWQSWEENSETGEWLWRSHIFKGIRSYYGACHGVAGNAHAFLRGREFLPKDWADIIVQRTTQTLMHGSIKQGADINWPLSAETDVVGKKRLVQWCHGAPGVVTALAGTNSDDCTYSDELHTMLIEAAEFVWNAGPLTKGPGLCHGTAGNGYAFLALYNRTGERIWLDRARRFAMHAVDQSQRAREAFGQRRYTLWTGDGGLAIYLHHCLAPELMTFPGLEDL